MGRRSALQTYLTQSDVPLEKHVRRKIVALADEHRSRTKIYLDTNFWVMLRDAEGGVGTSHSIELLHMLSAAVEEGKIICPLSESTFIELMGQSDPATLSATAALMDRLSLGLCLIDQQMRMGTEVGYLFHSNVPPDQLYPLDDLVWCKVAFVLGFSHPETDALPYDIMLALQKGTFDEMWEMPLVQMIKQIGPQSSKMGDDLQPIADQLNREIAQYKDAIRSFKQAYRAEAAGVASIFGKVISQTFQAQYEQQRDPVDSGGFEIGEDVLNKALHLTALALEKDKGKRMLRTLHVMASLHAAHRWDKHRILDSHDLLDFNHAAAALSYCNVFFTENPLKTMIEQRHVGLPDVYEVKLASTAKNALFVLREQIGL